MIVLDTSALISVLLRQHEWERVAEVLKRDTHFVISAGTLAEARIVAFARNVGARLESMLAELAHLDIVAVDAAMAERIAAAYRRYGKGYHAAGLNFGDCFAYTLAKDLDCPLLFVGRDFPLTDVGRALDEGVAGRP